MKIRVITKKHIEVVFIKSRLEARYGYIRTNTITGKTTRGLQFDPLGELEFRKTYEREKALV